VDAHHVARSDTPRRAPFNHSTIWATAPLPDVILNREQLWTLTEARVVIEDYRNRYNQCRPHSKLSYRSPASWATSLSPSLAPVRPAEPGLPSARDEQPISTVSTLTNYPDRT
jgi:hypothetical protein